MGNRSAEKLSSVKHFFLNLRLANFTQGPIYTLPGSLIIFQWAHYAFTVAPYAWTLNSTRIDNNMKILTASKYRPRIRSGGLQGGGGELRSWRGRGRGKHVSFYTKKCSCLPPVSAVKNKKARVALSHQWAEWNKWRHLLFESRPTRGAVGSRGKCDSISE